MKHPDENTLLKYVLELLESEEETLVKIHIEKCENCKEKYKQIKDGTNLLKGFDPEIETGNMSLPVKKEFIFSFWLKAAAILLIGFILGYYTAIQINSKEVNVVEQNLISKPFSNPANEFTPCEQVDL